MAGSSEPAFSFLAQKGAALTCKVKFHPSVEFNPAKSYVPKGGI